MILERDRPPASDRFSNAAWGHLHPSKPKPGLPGTRGAAVHRLGRKRAARRRSALLRRLPAVSLHLGVQPALYGGAEGRWEVGKLDAILPFFGSPRDAAHHLCFPARAGYGEAERNRRAVTQEFVGLDAGSAQAQIHNQAVKMLIGALHADRDLQTRAIVTLLQGADRAGGRVHPAGAIELEFSD